MAPQYFLTVGACLIIRFALKGVGMRITMGLRMGMGMRMRMELGVFGCTLKGMVIFSHYNVW